MGRRKQTAADWQHKLDAFLISLDDGEEERFIGAAREYGRLTQMKKRMKEKRITRKTLTKIRIKRQAQIRKKKYTYRGERESQRERENEEREIKTQATQVKNTETGTEKEQIQHASTVDETNTQ